MIYDLEGIAITSASMTMAPSESRNFDILIDCRADYFIRADCGNPDVTINGKANVGDAFVDIEATPINISSYAPARRRFYFEIEIAPGADESSNVVNIIVAK